MLRLPAQEVKPELPVEKVRDVREGGSNENRED